MRENILVILSCTVLCILVIVIIYRKFLLPAKIQKKLFQNNVFDNITNNTDMMVLVYYPLKHRVEFVSDSVGWLFGLDKFRVSRNIYYLFDKLNIPAEDEIVKGFCNGSSMLSAQKEYEFESPAIHEKRWIRLRTVPCDKGRYVLIVMDNTLEHEGRDTLITALKAVDQMRRINQNLIMTLEQDILNPINGIGEMMPMVQINIEDSVRVKECLMKIAAFYKELIERMDEVFGFSRENSYAGQVAYGEFNLWELLHEIDGAVEGQMIQRNHYFEIKPHFRHENVFGDRGKLMRIILNLLNNAIKFTPVGGKITLTVWEIPVWRGNAQFNFVVEDNGIGIKKEFVSKIFEPFERADDIRVREEQGIGLGMAAVKNLLDLLDGKIEVETEPEHGSCFTVSLKMRVPHDLEENKLHYVSDRVQNGTEDYHGKHILFVEDNDTNLKMVCELLQCTGADIDTAVNGQEAVSIFASSSEGYYDLVFMDVQMPVMDGNEATRQIRALRRRDAKVIPIVAMTACVFAEDIRKALKAGMDMHVVKPLDTNKLMEVMNKYLAG